MATREDRIFWQSLKLCPVCHKNRLYGSEKQCPECRAKHNVYQNKRYEQNRDAVNKANRKSGKKLYARRKQDGLCTRCGSPNVKPGYAKCYICLEKDASLHRLRRLQRVGDVLG